MGDKVRVIIDDMRRIPTIGKGPVRNPIYIEKDIYDLLKLLGFNVIIVENEKIQKIETTPSEDEKEITETPEEEVIVEESAEEVVEATEDVVGVEVVEEQAEESVETEEEIVEEVTEESAEEVVEESNEEKVLDIEKMTKKELKEELDLREIKYAYNATVDTLRELLREAL